MRLLEVKQALLESRTMAKSLQDEPTRAAAFLAKIKASGEFPIEKGKLQKNVIIAPSEYNRLKAAITAKNLNGFMVKTTDGEMFNINNFLKTADLGGKEAEKIAVKPSDVWAVDGQEEKKDPFDPTSETNIRDLEQAGAFPLRELNDRIQSNPKLDALGNVGQAIREISQQFTDKKLPVVPSYLSPVEKKAIELYASEYLGILSIYNRVAKFDKRPAFDKFVGSDLGDLLLYFPKDVATPLADSFAIQNKKNGHTLYISSKGGSGKGAAPSVTGLKIPDHVREDERFKKEVEYLDLAQSKNYTGKNQPFALMNWLFENAPDTISEQFYPYLPWTQEWIDAIEDGYTSRSKFPAKDMKAFISTLKEGRPSDKATDAGVIFYATITDVNRAINTKNALPNIQAVVLETLGYNFIQVYTNMSSGKVQTKVFYPAKIDGKVKFLSKSSANDPGKGKVSFQVSD